MILLESILLFPMVYGQFFTKTVKTIPRMGRRSEAEPLSKLDALRSSYDYSTRSDEDDLSIGNMIDRRNMIPTYIDSAEQDEPAYSSITIKKLKDILMTKTRPQPLED
ncbi:uncharacterized protein LOC141853330 isoform X2 [Brevipalpus obovatus]